MSTFHKSNLRRKLSDGQVVTGMIGFLGTPMAIEIMARAGIDFVMIDMEHCPMDMGQLAHLVRAADASGIAPLVRVPDVEPGLIKRTLNLGVAGIVIPHATRASCAALVQAARYPPDGQRGACPIVRATEYWPDDWNAYSAHANREIIVLPLLEDQEAIADFDALAGMPGIDGFFVGPYDLSVSVGAPGASFEHPKMSAALDRVTELCRRHGKFVVTTVGDRQERAYSEMLIGRGVQGLVFATDALVFLKACQRMVANLK
jgi:2-keto-3-deoxy-L-rhamnonate aldolase RhmA